MAVVIAHLTDLHVKTGKDPLLSRADSVARAIASEVDAGTNLVILAIGGDSVFSGQAEQFSQVTTFYLAIQTKLQQERDGVPTPIVVVAGNHDCDFNNSELSAAPQDSIAGEKASPGTTLVEFFKFEKALALTYPPHSVESPYFTWADFTTDGVVLRFLLANSSVFSQLHEVTDSLVLPIDELLPQFIPTARYVVTLLHHPWNWFRQPDTMRGLRHRLEELSDIILTGHEHEPETVDITRDGVNSTLYVSGGVLQESLSPSISTFVVIKLDLLENTRATVTFELTESGFYQQAKSCPTRQFPGNPARLGRPFDLNDVFSKELDDLGFVIHHPRKQFLTLRDIFVYPDLMIVDEPSTPKTNHQLKSKDVASTVLKVGKVLISGGEKGGKTCLAKSLFREGYSKGRLPILLNGKEIQTRKANSVRDYVRRAVRDQYKALPGDHYEQLDKSLRIVIVDDFELMVESPTVRAAILDELTNTFSSVVLIGGETYCFELLEKDTKQDSHLVEYRHYNIMNFGELQREQFIRKWVLLGNDGQAASDTREITAHLTKVLNGVIRKTLLPSYPLFLMIVLQQAESGQPTVRGGSYGHLFESVVTTILNRSRFTKISISAKHLYLATLASQLYENNQASLAEAEGLEWHQVYWKAIGASIDFSQLMTDLVSLNILQRTSDRISFRYKYHYCFFVAYYMSENINNPVVRSSIRQLSRQLYHRETGDILLFLSHLSNDSIVLDEMLNAAEVLLPEAQEANYVADVVNINHLEKTAPLLAVPRGDSDGRRVANLEHKDEQTLARSSADADGSILSSRPNAVEDDKMVREALQLPAAFKTIQILGQFARNHADSLPIAIKERVIDSLFRLAKRILGRYFEALDGDLANIADNLAETWRRDDPDIARDALVKQIGRHIFGMSQLTSFIVTKHVSSAVAHDLIEKVSRETARRMKDLPSQFFDLAVSLERPGFIDLDRVRAINALVADNPFGLTFLRMLVAYHIYPFNVNYKIKQAVCSELEIRQSKNSLNQDSKQLKSSGVERNRKGMDSRR
jgi:predicted phosphodiesterase